MAEQARDVVRRFVVNPLITSDDCRSFKDTEHFRYPPSPS